LKKIGRKTVVLREALEVFLSQLPSISADGGNHAS
jgi:hypothetical protein